VAAVVERLLKGDKYGLVEYRVRHKDGHYVWVESTSRLVRDAETGEPQEIITVTRDITERREAERAIRESEARYRLLAENVTDVITINTLDGSAPYISPSVQSLMGYAPEDLYKMDFLSTIHPDDHPKIMCVITNLKDKGTSARIEYRVKHRSGRYVWVESVSRILNDEETGEPWAMISVLRDISERKRAEDALRASSERIQIMYEIDRAILAAQSPDAIACAVLDRLWQLVDCQQSAVIVFDYEAETARMLAMQLHEVARTMPEAELPLHFFDYVTQGIYNEPKIRQGAMSDIHLEGIGLPLVQYGLVLYANLPLVVHGEMIGILNMCRDRDEAFSARQMEIAAEVADSLAVAVYQARLQEALRDNMAHLQESLREKEVLLQEIHHRVKNNLQVVSSLLNLQKGNINDREVIVTLEESRSRVKAMALVHEWLYRSEDFARINFADYLRSLTAHLFSTYNIDAQRVRLDIKGRDFALGIDQAVPCGLIINELVTNALAYAFPDDREGRITVSLESEGSLRRLTIADDGVGLPEDVNWQNTQTLGLQLISILTQQLGGTIQVDRTSGTAYHITFAQPDST
jgi:PAS domain S-box-containing protein